MLLAVVQPQHDRHLLPVQARGRGGVEAVGPAGPGVPVQKARHADRWRERLRTATSCSTYPCSPHSPILHIPRVQAPNPRCPTRVWKVDTSKRKEPEIKPSLELFQVYCKHNGCVNDVPAPDGTQAACRRRATDPLAVRNHPEDASITLRFDVVPHMHCCAAADSVAPVADALCSLLVSTSISDDVHRRRAAVVVRASQDRQQREHLTFPQVQHCTACFFGTQRSVSSCCSPRRLLQRPVAQQQFSRCLPHEPTDATSASQRDPAKCLATVVYWLTRRWRSDP